MQHKCAQCGIGLNRASILCGPYPYKINPQTLETAKGLLCDVCRSLMEALSRSIPYWSEVETEYQTNLMKDILRKRHLLEHEEDN